MVGIKISPLPSDIDERRSWSIINVEIFIASEKLSVIVPVDKFSVKASRVTVVLSGTIVIAGSPNISVILLPYTS